MSGTTGTVPLQNAIPDQLITSALWNQEFSNIGALLDANGTGGHSDTDADAQIQTNPYPGSVLSKAASIAGELERLRYQMAQILGTDFWYKPTAINLASTNSVVVPLGGIIDYPIATAPGASWHLADGTAISRSIYATLFALIGTTFGIGDGTTTFTLPDYRDRMSIGAGNLYAVGVTGGAVNVTISTDQMPVHNHPININDPGHRHELSEAGIQTFGTSGTIRVSPRGTNGNDPANLTNTDTTGITATSSNTGGGSPVPTLPPYLGMYKMIRIL